MRKLFLLLICLAIQCQSLVYAAGSALPCPMQEHTAFSHCDMESKKASTACKTCCKHPVNCEASATLAVKPHGCFLSSANAQTPLIPHAQTALLSQFLREVWRPPLMA